MNSGSVGNSLSTNKNAFSLQSLHTQNNGDVNRMTLELMTTKAQLVKMTRSVEDINKKVREKLKIFYRKRNFRK